MANKQHVEILEQGVEVWNAWREMNPDIQPDLSGFSFPANLNMEGINFRHTNLRAADLSNTHLISADLSKAYMVNATLDKALVEKTKLVETILEGANLHETHLIEIECRETIFNAAVMVAAQIVNSNIEVSYFVGTDLRTAVFFQNITMNCFFHGANLSQATLRETGFYSCNFKNANFTEASFWGAILQGSSFVEANVEGADFSQAYVYGVSIWNLKGTPKAQKDLVISGPEEPAITTDNLEVAQFIYLMYSNQKIREVLNSLSAKGVLILGRFSPPERKEVLDALRDKLREKNLLPIVFDFDRPTDKDYTETVQTLAGMCMFVIVDVTNPKSTPLELEATAKQFKIPFVPILDGTADEYPFSMLQDLQNAFHWVLPTFKYQGKDQLIDNIDKVVIQRANQKMHELRDQKANQQQMLTLDDL